MKLKLPNTQSKNEAKEWYLKQAKSAGKSSKQLYVNSIRVLIAVWLLPFSYSAFLLYAKYMSFKEGYNFDDSIFGSVNALTSQLILLFAVLVFIWNKTIDRVNEFGRNIQSGKMKIIESDLIKPIHEIVLELKSKMNIEANIHYVHGNSNTNLPSIEEYKNEIYLVFPTNFFTLVQKDKEAAECLIAHELGHIIQRDTRLWLLLDSFGTHVQKYLVPAVLILALPKILGIVSIAFEANINPLNSNTIMYLLNIVVIVFFLSGIRQARRRSEYLADFASVLYTEKRGMQKALAEYSEDAPAKARLRIHPLKEDRINFLKEIPVYS